MIAPPHYGDPTTEGKMSHDLREGAFGLMAELCRDHELPLDALRLTSHMLVNLGDDASTESFSAISDALPWLAAFIELQKAEPAAYVAHRLEAREGLRALDSNTVERLLEVSAAQSQPRPVDWSRRLTEVAALDRQLVQLSLRNARSIREALIVDTRLLRAVVELLEGGSRTGPAMRFREIFPEWRPVGNRDRSQALSVLEDLEHTWDGGNYIKSLRGLTERSRRFELSSTDHLKQNGFLPALRAALALAPLAGPIDEGEGAEWLDDALAKFVTLREDPALLALARALAMTRWRCLEHIRGAAPLSSLSPWVGFLRGPCAELAEARSITLREATSFSHFCLHLMNFCDLAGFEPDATHDRLRRTLMDLEDELKEFALVGQEQGLTDLQADLERYDAVRWKPAKPRKMVVDRLARLTGAWRLGFDASPLGSPPKIDEAEFQRVDAALEQVFGAAPLAPVLAQLLQPCRLSRAEIFEKLEPELVVQILTLVLTAARDLPGLDASRAFEVDLQPVAAWLSRGGTEERTALLESLMDAVDIEAVALGEDEYTERQEGIVLSLHGSQRLVVEIVTSQQTQALLTLLSSEDIDWHLREALAERLSDSLSGRHTSVSLDEPLEILV